MYISLIKNEINKRVMICLSPLIISLIPSLFYIFNKNMNIYVLTFSSIFLLFLGIGLMMLTIHIYSIMTAKTIHTIKMFFNSIVIHISCLIIYLFFKVYENIKVLGFVYSILSFFFFIPLFFIFKSIIQTLSNDLLFKITQTNLICLIKKTPYWLFIVLFNLVLFLFDLFNVYDNIYLIILFVFAAFEFFLIDNLNKRYEDIDVNYFNLDFIDIINKPIFLEYHERIENMRIFKIDISSIIEDNAEIYILNHQYLLHPDKGNKDITGNYIYYAINKRYYFKTIKIKIFTKAPKSSKYTKNKKYIINLYFNIDNKSNELILSEPYIEKYRNIFKFVLREKKLNKKINIKDYVTHLSSMLNNAYYYNKDIMDEGKKFFKQNLCDNRKWLLHDDKMGYGKSVLDHSLITNNGYRPIVISPWEDNYDEDFIYLIYTKLMKNTKTKPVKDDKTIIIFFIGIFVALVTLYFNLFNIIEDMINSFLIGFHFQIKVSDLFVIKNTKGIFDFIKGGLMIGFNQYTFHLFDICIGISSVLLALLGTFYLLPYAIIHVKNSSKIHQSYYLKGIKKALTMNKVMLIIEDIDRLEEKPILDMFRVLSSINTFMQERDKPIGIISLYSDSNKIQRYKNDLSNKVIYDIILQDVDLKKSMILYFLKYTEAFSYATNKTLLTRKEKEMIIKEIYSNDNINFRDVHKILNEIVIEYFEKGGIPF